MDCAVFFIVGAAHPAIATPNWGSGGWCNYHIYLCSSFRFKPARQWGGGPATLSNFLLLILRVSPSVFIIVHDSSSIALRASNLSFPFLLLCVSIRFFAFLRVSLRLFSFLCVSLCTLFTLSPTLRRLRPSRATFDVSNQSAAVIIFTFGAAASAHSSARVHAPRLMKSPRAVAVHKLD